MFRYDQNSWILELSDGTFEWDMTPDEMAIEDFIEVRAKREKTPFYDATLISMQKRFERMTMEQQTKLLKTLGIRPHIPMNKKTRAIDLVAYFEELWFPLMEAF